MFKVLPQMHRLAQQVCERYDVQIAHTVVDTEGIREFTDGRTDHFPYYIVELAAHGLGWRYLCCRPLRGKFCDYSMSQNNVVVVIRFDDGTQLILPSWRGKLVERGKLSEHRYHIERGYMPVEPYPDYTEDRYINYYLGLLDGIKRPGA